MTVLLLDANCFDSTDTVYSRSLFKLCCLISSTIVYNDNDTHTLFSLINQVEGIQLDKKRSYRKEHMPQLRYILRRHTTDTEHIQNTLITQLKDNRVYDIFNNVQHYILEDSNTNSNYINQRQTMRNIETSLIKLQPKEIDNLCLNNEILSCVLDYFLENQFDSPLCLNKSIKHYLEEKLKEDIGEEINQLIKKFQKKPNRSYNEAQDKYKKAFKILKKKKSITQLQKKYSMFISLKAILNYIHEIITKAIAEPINIKLSNEKLDNSTIKEIIQIDSTGNIVEVPKETKHQIQDKFTINPGIGSNSQNKSIKDLQKEENICILSTELKIDNNTVNKNTIKMLKDEQIKTNAILRQDDADDLLFKSFINDNNETSDIHELNQKLKETQEKLRETQEELRKKSKKNKELMEDYSKEKSNHTLTQNDLEMIMNLMDYILQKNKYHYENNCFLIQSSFIQHKLKNIVEKNQVFKK